MPKKTIEQNMNMTQEEKQLLLKDFCGRLPYGVKIEKTYVDYPTALHEEDIVSWKIGEIKIKPYLRPMSSMTEEERGEFCGVGGVMSYSPQHDSWAISAFAPEAYDWLNSHHFDFRGLIEKGLAIEASEGMYKIEKDMEWIKCYERMPEEHKYESDNMQGHHEWTESKRVLVWDSMYGPGVDSTRNGKWMSEHLGGYQGQVIHGIVAWMPIPEFKEEDYENS